MQKLVFIVAFSFWACNNNQQQAINNSDTAVMHADILQKITASNAYADEPNITTDTVAIAKPEQESIKDPSGIYRVILPYNDSIKFEQIVKFNNDNTYRLQEKFMPGKKDSLVLSEGTWAPSNGCIWLYKDQVVAGRYKWKGNELQYYDPQYKKTYAMHPLSDIMSNKTWKDRKEQGFVVFGVGNEPFWSVALNNNDTISFRLADWDDAVKMKVSEAKMASDTTVYLAQNDSSKLKLMVLPYFCSDGMSDFIYPNKVQVQYNHQTYRGCGVLYK